MEDNKHLSQKEEDEKIKQEIATAIKEQSELKNKIKLIALNHNLEKKKQLDEQYAEEIKALRVKYEKLSQPIYSSTNEIISGTRKPTAEELANADNFLADTEKSQKDTQNVEGELEEYWLKAFLNCDMLQPEINEKDEEALAFLTKIEYTLVEGSEDFELVFHFKENPFFTNTTLKKTFKMEDDDEPEETTGTEIAWKAGKNTTKKMVKKTQKNKKSGAKRVVEKEEDCESFFNFFKNSKCGDEDENDNDDDDDEGHEGERIHIDFDIARTIIDEVLPYSLEYYLGIKKPEEGDFEDEDDDEEGGKGGDDDDDDDEEDAKPAKGKGKK